MKKFMIFTELLYTMGKRRDRNETMKTKHIRNGKAIILELKVADKFQDMEKRCKQALKQIEE